jgi:hypothetical protein
LSRASSFEPVPAPRGQRCEVFLNACICHAPNPSTPFAPRGGEGKGMRGPNTSIEQRLATGRLIRRATRSPQLRSLQPGQSNQPWGRVSHAAGISQTQPWIGPPPSLSRWGQRFPTKSQPSAVGAAVEPAVCLASPFRRDRNHRDSAFGWLLQTHFQLAAAPFAVSAGLEQLQSHTIRPPNRAPSPF